ncbi:MAG: glycosyltransferase family 2 protein [Phycisphaerae bacterium]|nr:glycosyltransferase family 2 protein [Phycisphaerae bacterium]
MGLSAGTISVIVACRNAAATLGEALESVLAQTVPPMEILVVDDRSTDESAALARSFGPRIRVLVNPGRGPGAARRLGVSEASGEYIAFVDADDTVEPTKHEQQLAVLQSRPPGTVVHTGSYLYWADSSRAGYRRPGGEKATGQCLQTIFEANPLCSASIMLRRSLILELGNYDPELIGAEDYHLSLRAATCCDFVYLPEPLYRIRRHAGSITHRQSLMAFYHWLAQDKFRRQYPEAFAALPPDVIRRSMVDPVLRAVEGAYWRRDPDGYQRLLRLAIGLVRGNSFGPAERAGIERLWRRRWCPMLLLRWLDRIRSAQAQPRTEVA